MSTSQGNGQLSDVQMPFTAHLAELRSRLIKSALAVGVAFFACFAVVDDIFAILAAPVRSLHIRGLMLIGTAVTEAFFTKMKVSFVAAVMLASPVLLWQAWQFIAPGLMSMRNVILAALSFLVRCFLLPAQPSATPS